MLISEAYLKEQKRLHERANYGAISHIYGPLVQRIINQVGALEVLDYGAGKQALRDHIPEFVYYRPYDPAIDEISAPPEPAQMVVCTDMLEHVEPELLDNVLDDLKRLTVRVLFATVHTGPAMKTLSDGRNAHLTQQPVSWWLPKFWERWDVQTYTKAENGFWLVAYAC